MLEAARNGDKSAFRSLVLKYESQVAATIYGMLGRCEEAEDIGQETFMRFYKAMNRFKGESSVGTYIIRIAINLSLNEIKRRKRRSRWFLLQSENEIEIESFPAENSASTLRPEQEEIKSIVRSAIQKLEPKFRMVVVLRLIDGYTTQETARILELPVGTVLSRLARAQDKLKSILGLPKDIEVPCKEKDNSISNRSVSSESPSSAIKHIIVTPQRGVLRG